MVSSVAVFDTSIFIDQFRTQRHQHRVDVLRGLIRTSSVVLAELWRGATTATEHEALNRLAKNHPILTPTGRDWVESGQILNKIRARTGFSPEKLRDFHFDVSIALTARSHGARLITSNRNDFELISSYRKFELEVWA